LPDRWIGAVSLIAALAPGVASGQGGAAMSSDGKISQACSDAGFRQFDYWLGAWMVTDTAGRPVGTSHVIRVSDGCAILEQWKDASGNAGTSLNFYDRGAESWEQTWMGAQGGVLRLRGGLENGVMTLQGRVVLALASGDVIETRLGFHYRLTDPFRRLWQVNVAADTRRTCLADGRPGFCSRKEGVMLKLSDIMTRDVVTVGPDVSLREVLQLFSENHISGAPVLIANKIAGVVSVSDLIDIPAMTPAVEDAGDTRRAVKPESETGVLDECTVSEVMTRYPIWKMRPDAPVPAAADCMRQNGIHRILVVEDEKLLGIVTAWDIAKAVADNKLTTRTFVFGAERDFDERGWWTEWLLDDG